MVSAAVRYDRGSPELLISNESSIDDREVRKVVAAIQTQVDGDFFPLWGWRARLIFQPKRPPRHPMRIRLKNSNREGHLGYHFIDGAPEAEVFTQDAQGRTLKDWHATLSHEVLEMIADPGVNLYARGFVQRAGRRRKAFIAYEVCDPVQERCYELCGVRVSDFVTPEWFEPERVPGTMKFSFKGSVTGPFELGQGGYIDAFVDGRFITVSGPRAGRQRRRHRRAARAARLG